jgi:hypothetical protein
MNDIRNVGQEVQAEVLKAARKGQEAFVGAIKTWTGTVRSMTPKDLSLPFADRLPFANRLPKPEELAGNAYEFAHKLLASQRKFAEGVLHAAAPMLPRSDDTAAKTGSDEKTATDTGTKKSGSAAKKSGPAAK